jgi:two-component system NtrC family sensor kinase
VVALATNAIDAMPEGGTLTLRAQRSGANVIVEIKDTGFGIAQENLTKIFDPFFTTKGYRPRTGLGLAVCYGIVSEHGGRLDVRPPSGSEQPSPSRCPKRVTCSGASRRFSAGVE